MNSHNLPWPEQYRPLTLREIVGNQDAIAGIRAWILSWKNNLPIKRSALLVGPPGVGKTATVIALAKDLDVELVEFNASDKRNKAAIETQVWRAATQQTIDGRMRIVLLDEVDGLSGVGDRGGIGAILKVIAETLHPIVMTANDPESPRLKDLLKICQVFSFGPIEPEDVLIVLRRIVVHQSSSITDHELLEIVENSGGDLRAAVSDLETHLKTGIREVPMELATRDVKLGIRRAIRRLTMTTNTRTARRVIDEFDLDHDQLLLWLEENLHLHLVHPVELRAGFEALSLADLTLGRIFREQNWKLLAYAYDFLSVGVATSRSKSPFRDVGYSAPSWPLLVWKGNRKRDKRSDLLAKLSSVAGVSKARVHRTHVDTIDRIIERFPKSRNDFAVWLGVKKAIFDRR